jgi:predicted HAD superfamily Cof-like phosphohydrolase
VIQNQPYRQVLQFHVVYKHPIGNNPKLLTPDRLRLRQELVEEELQELQEAIDANDIIEQADALGDLVYVIMGWAIEMGIRLDLVINEIHKSNMSKLGEDGKPIYREDGKVLKGPNYQPPNLQPILGVPDAKPATNKDVA